MASISHVQSVLTLLPVMYSMLTLCVYKVCRRYCPSCRPTACWHCVCTKALNEAQFELEHRQSSLLQSQQTWAGRFDRFDVITHHVSSCW